MAKPRNNDEDQKNTENKTEEVIINNPKQPMISSKNFAKNLRKELKTENIPEAVFVAFERTVPTIDTEENYKAIWLKTFKRK